MTIPDRQEAIERLYAKIKPPKSAPAPRLAAPVTGSDAEILDRAKRARNGAKFTRLFGGDASYYGGDQSRADAALSRHLLFWTGGDPDRADGLFRQSGLFRAKWDERRGDETYGRRTLRTVRDGMTKFYSPRRNGHHTANGNGYRTEECPTFGEQRNAAEAAESASGTVPEADRTPPCGTVSQGHGIGAGVNEKANDPHRLARVCKAPYETPDGCRLVYHLEQFHEQEGPAYRTVATAEMRARFTAGVKEEYNRVNREQLAGWTPEKESDKPPSVLPVTSGLISNVLQAAAGYCNVPGTVTAPAWLDGPGPFPADELLACTNGLVHVPTYAAGKPGYLIPATPRYFGFTALEYSFDANAVTPHCWLDFLGQLWPGDPESVNCLQEWFGYLLLSDTRLQKILLLIGPKRGGKGTIARVLRGLIGAANVAGPTLGSLSQNFGLWPLLTKPLAVISDARLSGRTDSAIVTERLLSISGEDTLTIDRKHMAPVTVKLPTRFVILTNELPRLGDSSGALAGRFIVLRLSRSWYGKEDHALTDRLLNERAGILLWAIQGWKQLQARGRFVQPASGGQLVTDLEDLSSPVGAFVREVCEAGPGLTVGKAELYQRWNRWRESRGMKETSAPIFGRDLRAAVPSVDERRPHADGGRICVYVGIGIRPGVEVDDIPP